LIQAVGCQKDSDHYVILPSLQFVCLWSTSAVLATQLQIDVRKENKRLHLSASIYEKPSILQGCPGQIDVTSTVAYCGSIMLSLIAYARMTLSTQSGAACAELTALFNTLGLSRVHCIYVWRQMFWHQVDKWSARWSTIIQLCDFCQHCNTYYVDCVSDC